MAKNREKLYLLFEFLALYGGAPLVILALKNRGLMILTLWIGALMAWLVLHRVYKISHRREWNFGSAKSHIHIVLRHFAILTPLLTAFAWFYSPHSFFAFPLERPQTWLTVMLLYPLLSVWPQEILYRSFLYHRYRPLLPSPRAYVAASALAFGFMHILFANGLAILLTTLGGALFARSYNSSKSLALVCLEHALYGCLVFTVGLGIYFYSRAAWGQT